MPTSEKDMQTMMHVAGENAEAVREAFMLRWIVGAAAVVIAGLAIALAIVISTFKPQVFVTDPSGPALSLQRSTLDRAAIGIAKSVALGLGNYEATELQMQLDAIAPLLAPRFRDMFMRAAQNAAKQAADSQESKTFVLDGPPMVRRNGTTWNVVVSGHGTIGRSGQIARSPYRAAFAVTVTLEDDYFGVVSITPTTPPQR
jgi:hypothetical protein